MELCNLICEGKLHWRHKQMAIGMMLSIIVETHIPPKEVVEMWLQVYFIYKKFFSSSFFFFLVSHLRLSQQKDDTVEGWLKPFYCHNTLPATAYQLFWWLILFLEHQPPPWPGTYLLLVKTLLERRRPYMNSNFMITLLFIQRDNLSLPGIWTPVPPWNRVWSTGSTNGTPCFLFFITYFTISQNLSSNKICWWTEQRWTVKQWEPCSRYLNQSCFSLVPVSGWRR